jgi:AhpD family alkylhydroperoxidase
MQTQTRPHTRLASRDVKRHVPGLYPAAVALADAAAAAGLDETIIALVDLRVSQINGCAYCVQLHTTEGHKLGVPPEKLTLVVTWREGGIFSPREQAALAWAEELTLIANRHVPDSAWEVVREQFTDREIVGLTAAINATNVWNRIAVPFRYAPEI